MCVQTRQIGRIIVPLCLLLVLAAATPLAGAAEGNNPTAKLCQKGGWQSLAPAEDPTVPFASEEAGVGYGAQGGTIVAVQVAEIFLTFRQVEFSPTACWVDVHLRHFAADTAYSVESYLNFGIVGMPPEIVNGSQITTDGSGSADFTPYWTTNGLFEARAVTTTGVASAWTLVAC